ncbi:lipase, partial [Streptomyces sp. NRRL S-4]
MQQHLPSGDISPRRHRMSKSRSRTVKLAVAAAAATAGLVTALVPGGAQAADNPYERGPAPSNSSIEASRGSYATSQTSVSSLSVRGFGGGTIYYPTSTSDGTFGAVVISPGF